MTTMPAETHTLDAPLHIVDVAFSNLWRMPTMQPTLYDEAPDTVHAKAIDLLITRTSPQAATVNYVLTRAASGRIIGQIVIGGISRTETRLVLLVQDEASRGMLEQFVAALAPSIAGIVAA